MSIAEHSSLLPCFVCGYDLRGSPATGQCPECGYDYRRESLYLDVARQKLRPLINDAQFVVIAGLSLLGCLFCLAPLMGASNPTGPPFASPMTLQAGLLAAFFYAMLVAMYAYCWMRICFELYWRRTLLWGQVRGVGLAASLWWAGGALGVTPLLAACWLRLM